MHDRDSPWEDALPTGSESGVGALLRARRQALRLSGSTLAARTGMSQAKISRIETGRTAVSSDDARLLAEAMRMTPEEIDALVRRAAESGSGDMAQWRPESSELARQQKRFEQIEQASREIRIFQPAVVPGLLQTSGYAETVMRSWFELRGTSSELLLDHLYDAVASRVRRQRILADAGKRFHFVLTESTLSNRLGNPEDMLAQIRRIREIARRPHVSIAILTADAPLTYPPTHSFELLDDEYLLLDLYTLSLSSEVVSDVRSHRQIFDAMAEAATSEIEPILDRYSDLYHGLSARR
jgi:transcriptional regulator with XRE-family HTH domain